MGTEEKDPDATGMTYKSVGVNYDNLDPFKCEGAIGSAETHGALKRFGFFIVPWTVGESVTLIDTPFGYLGLLAEGLGTKSLVADGYFNQCETANTVQELLGRSLYDNVGQCNVAMAVNDMITLGAEPYAYVQYVGVGDDKWFEGERGTERRRDLIRGTVRACLMAGCAWTGGETPALSGIIDPSTADLAGATSGIIMDRRRLINPANIQAGDSIVLIGSSGIHANGLTLARKVAAKMPKGYLTELPSGQTYGEALLAPTHIYVELVRKCQDQGVHPHYTVNVTGHGWNKLMRATQPFNYVIERLPEPHEVFLAMQEYGNVKNRDAYDSLNMGTGFVLYTSHADAAKAVRIAQELGFTAFVGGYVDESPDEKKRVILTPIGQVYDKLGIR